MASNGLPMDKLPGLNISSSSSNSSSASNHANSLKLSPIGKALAANHKTSLYPDMKTDIGKLKERVSPIRKVSAESKDKGKIFDISKPAARLSPIRKLGTPKRNVDTNSILQRERAVNNLTEKSKENNSNKDESRSSLSKASNGNEDDKISTTYYKDSDIFGVTQSVDRKSHLLDRRPANNLSFLRLNPGTTIFDKVKDNTSATSEKVLASSNNRSTPSTSRTINRLRIAPHSESRVSKRLTSRLTNSAFASSKFKDLYSNMNKNTIFDNELKPNNGSGALLASPLSAKTEKRLDRTFGSGRLTGNNSLLDKLKNSSNIVISSHNRQGINTAPSYLLPTASSISRQSPEKDGEEALKQNFKEFDEMDATSPIKLRELTKQHHQQQQEQQHPIQSKDTQTKQGPKLKSCLKTKTGPPASESEGDSENEEKENIFNPKMASAKQEKSNGLALAPSVSANTTATRNLAGGHGKKRKSVSFSKNIEELNQDNSITKRLRSPQDQERKEKKEDILEIEDNDVQLESLPVLHQEQDTKGSDDVSQPWLLTCSQLKLNFRDTGKEISTGDEKKVKSTEIRRNSETGKSAVSRTTTRKNGINKIGSNTANTKAKAGTSISANNSSVNSNNSSINSNTSSANSANNNNSESEITVRMELLGRSQNLILDKLELIDEEVRVCQDRLAQLAVQQAAIREAETKVQQELQRLRGWWTEQAEKQ